MAEIRNLTRNGETFYPLTHEKAVIGMEDFKDTITEQIDNYRPIEITGDVTNAPDEEDITSDSNNLLKFKNRNNLYGLGKVILRRGSSFASQVTQANTIYVIQYNFDLDSGRVNIPNGSILLFEGGTLSNGTLVCADLYDVRLVYYQDITVILSSVALEGNFIHKACDKDTIRQILVDNSSITKDVNDVLSVKTGGIQNSHLNSNVVDNSGISLDTNNKISIKDGGVTGNKLNSGIVNTDDLSIVNNKIQLSNRGTTDGMGKIILRKDQSFASQLTQQNTIYVIRYNFTLTSDVTIPANCVLEFKGGCLSGEVTITGQNTVIDADFVKIFDTSLALLGTWNTSNAYSEWFGAKGDNVSDDTIALQKTIDTFHKLHLLEKIYLISSPLIISSYYNIGGEGKQRSYIKKLTNTAASNIPLTKHSVDLNVDAIIIIKPDPNEPTGANTLNYVSIENVSLYGGAQSNKRAYGIIMAEGRNVKVHNVLIYGCSIGIRGEYIFMTSFDTVTVCFCYVGENAQFTGTRGFLINESSPNGGYTTINFDKCYAQQFEIGYKIHNVNYSLLSNCACDGCIKTAYHIYNCHGISMFTCGAEGTVLTNDNDSAIVYINGSCVTIVSNDYMSNGESTEEDRYYIRVVGNSSSTILYPSHFTGNNAQKIQCIGYSELYILALRHEDYTSNIVKDADSRVYVENGSYRDTVITQNNFTSKLPVATTTNPGLLPAGYTFGVSPATKNPDTILRGVYFTSNDWTGLPFDRWAGILIAVSLKDNHGYQVAINIADYGEYWIRTRVNGTWGAWARLALRTIVNGAAVPLYGSTRPTGLSVYDKGYMFFDESSSPAKPVWWNGTAWVDATGNPI